MNKRDRDRLIPLLRDATGLEWTHAGYGGAVNHAFPGIAYVVVRVDDGHARYTTVDARDLSAADRFRYGMRGRGWHARCAEWVAKLLRQQGLIP